MTLCGLAEVLQRITWILFKLLQQSWNNAINSVPTYDQKNKKNVPTIRIWLEYK